MPVVGGIETINLEDVTQPVTFKDILDFAYMDGGFTSRRPSCTVPFPVAFGNKQAELVISIYPKPVTNIVVIKVNMTQGENVQISFRNLLAHAEMNLDRGFAATGKQQLPWMQTNTSQA